ncbi:immunoglobulin superfamily member 1-like, partial [Terrapene carolina triunguis]|uniref:immunoglobulin superfamily member 1-like n=1 Tax=Terrapene triunguis TaxID=2587831 RepID=UPI0011565700
MLVAALRGPHCPVMASALTVLLGCWLAGHSGVWGGREFLKPTIWVSPSRVVALGGSVTIRCEGLYPGMKFFLHKAGHPNLQEQSVPDGTVAEFPIRSVGREDGGSYTCDYRSITDQNITSQLSDPVKIIVGEPSYPKPSISLRTSRGGAVSIWCRGQHRGVRFVLNKERRHFEAMDSDDFEAVFPISNMSREQSGSYSCSYHSRSEPFAVSYPSDPMELVVRAASPDFNKTNVARLGLSAVVVLVLGLILAEAYYSRPRGEPGSSRAGKRISLGYEPLYRLVELGTGVLVAALRDPHCPIMASALTILLLGCEFRKPTIWVSPSRVVALGGSVTIRCEGSDPGMEFFLRKAGHLNPQAQSVPNGTVAEFPIPSVSREDGGNYTCDYRSIAEQNHTSHPSDPIKIIVGEPIYPKPNIYPSRSRGVSLRGTVAIWCEGQRRGMRFVLNKERRHFQPIDATGFMVVFSLSNVSREDGGSYRCYYHSIVDPFNMSYPSDPMELVVR